MNTPHSKSNFSYQTLKANGGGSNRSHLRLRHNFGKYAPVTILPVALLVSAFASHSLTPVYHSHAEDLTAIVDSTGYFINLSSMSSGEVNMEINATTEGGVAMAEDNLNIKANTPHGYALYVAMEGADNNLYKDGNAASSYYFAPTAGTFAAPAVLDVNAWGYTLNKTSVIASENSFSGMPVKGQDQLIRTVETPDATVGDNTTIYYGVKANTAMPSGSYKGTVTYTAISRASVAAQDTASVSPAVTTKLEGGENLTIVTNLQIDPTTVELDEETGTNLTADGTDLSVELYVGGEVCTNKTFSRAEDNSLKINCLAPAKATGKYDVYIRIPKYSKVYTIVNGITYTYSKDDQQAVVDEVTGGNAQPGDILIGKTAFVDGTEITGTMPAFTSQYDNNKTAAENTADAGMTWNSEGTELTISAGYHTDQTIEAYSREAYDAAYAEGAASVKLKATKIGTLSAWRMCDNYACINATYDMSNIEGYENLTADNFLVKVTSVQTNVNGGGNGTQNPLSTYWTYSAPTLTVVAGGRMYGQLNSDGRVAAYLNGDVYYLPVAIEYE